MARAKPVARSDKSRGVNSRVQWTSSTTATTSPATPMGAKALSQVVRPIRPR